MQINRRLLRISAAFAATLLLGLGAADLGLFAYLRHDADRRLSEQVQLAAREFAQAVQRELLETPRDLATSTSEALKEWPADSTALVVYDAGGSRVAGHGDAGDDAREAVVRAAGPPPFRVVARRSTAGLRASNAKLDWWLALSVPLVILLAVAGGYFLWLLKRLGDAEVRSRRFLAQVAHQLRTPLTVIRGESSLGLERPRSEEEYRELLKRVSLAAEQMTHRVDDLFLLAQAEAGDRPPLNDRIEVDGLVLECVDLMRGRAQVLGRRLELGTVEPAALLGNEALVREALLELLENACRHGEAAAPIRVTALNGRSVRVEVASRGAAIAASALEGGDGPRRSDQPGLGLSIVRWIASVHGGRLAYRHDAGTNTFMMEFAVSPDPSGA